jgi:cytochrome c peroxidase
VRIGLALALALAPVFAAGPRVELGRRLFYDKRLSGNGTQSCATCHRQELAFTDGRAAPVGSTGQAHSRNAMTLVNVRDRATLTWSDPTMRSLARQALVPMFGERPVELGTERKVLVGVLRTDPVYRALFPKAFPEAKDPFTVANAVSAIAAFERTIVSAPSAYDRYYYGGEPDAISDAAKRGEVVFFTESLGGCLRCHNGRDFTDGGYHNTALSAEQTTRFRTPTLRNVELTAPYMHDGSIATLEDVVEHYARGGKENPRKDERMRALTLTRQNKTDLVEFLKALTDREVTRDPRWSDPW